jgi:hypothetical protein
LETEALVVLVVLVALEVTVVQDLVITVMKLDVEEMAQTEVKVVPEVLEVKDNLVKV